MLFNAVVFRRQGRQSEENVPNRRFASRIAVTVKEGERRRVRHQVVLAAEKDPLPGDEAVLEEDVRVRVSDVHTTLEMLPLVLAVDGDDLLDTFVVGGDGEGHGIVLLVRTQGAGGHHEDFVGDGNGSHGLRWNFAQKRFKELQIFGSLSYEQALQQVSWEMKHERSRDNRALFTIIKRIVI